jgi:hypothetical protein
VTPRIVTRDAGVFLLVNLPKISPWRNPFLSTKVEYLPEKKKPPFLSLSRRIERHDPQGNLTAQDRLDELVICCNFDPVFLTGNLAVRRRNLAPTL